MGGKGLDFKHKEVVNINDGKRLRVCARCNSRFKNRNNNKYNCAIKENSYLISNHDIYNCALIENRNMKFILERECERKSYITKDKQNRIGYTIKEKFEYDVICKVEL